MVDEILRVAKDATLRMTARRVWRYRAAGQCGGQSLARLFGRRNVGCEAVGTGCKKWREERSKAGGD